MKKFQRTAIAMGVAQFALMASGVAFAQSATSDTKADAKADANTVIVVGQRAALQSAQKIKQNADEVVDSIVADDMGKLPDRSVSEVLQRIVGVTMDRTMAKGDPEHFSVEGSGVQVRGLSYVRSELNGRDSFSANGGRSLNFEDVPPELMAGVDVYKNPSAEQIEGAIGGLINLRTALPFDAKGFKFAASIKEGYSELSKGKPKTDVSLMVSNRWKTSIGEVGALVDLAHSESRTRTDAFQVEPYYTRTDVEPGKTVYVPKGAQWRTLDFNREREGAYGALQWKLNDWASSLTYFKSRYKMQWGEQAIFAQSSPYNIKVANGTYNANGVFVSGLLTDPTDGGVNFNDDVRTADRHSDTSDLSWNLRWRANDRWTITTDVQRIKATTRGFDSTVATGVQIPKEQVNLGGPIPILTFDAGDLAYLANPKNYYWGFTMEHGDQSIGHETAWKTDVKYDFDHPVLRDLRFGVRLTKRDATTTNTNPSYNWAAISQPWQVGWDISKLASLGDPRFASGTHTNTFDNFFGGGVPVPSVVFPDLSQATGYPDSYAALHKFHDILCAEQTAAQGWGSGCAPWTPATMGTDPSGTNDQAEKTKAMYTQLRFGFDDLKYPIDGNVGLRYVQTNMTAHGYTVFKSNITIPAGNIVSGPKIPDIHPFAQAQDFDNTYHNFLPTLNLKMKATDKLQFRLAFGSAVSRPDFTQLQAYTALSQNADITTNTTAKTSVINSISQVGSATGNPNLRPTKSNQLDLTSEWYFAPTGSFTVAVFNKQLKDIIINQQFNFQLTDTTGKAQDFTVTAPVNGAKGHARGFELAFQTYFDMLPAPWSGLGMQANYTYVDSKRDLYQPVFQQYCAGGNNAANLNLNLNGCDTDGKPFGNMPLENLSKNSYNLALMFDRGPWSARFAYNWRSKSLQAVNANGTSGGDGLDTNPASPTFGQHNVGWALPTWSAAYGQLDASASYKITESLNLGMEASNLTDAKYRQLMQQHTGFNGRAWFSTGRRFAAYLRYTFQ